MAGTNDPRAAGFVGNEFRDAIRFVYDMAAPAEVDQQATFLFPKTLVYNLPTDAEDVPFDPASTVTSQSGKAPVKVTCGVEYFDGQGNPTEFGIVIPARAAVTVLDEEYALIKGCNAVVLGGEKYLYRRTDFPNALFDVGLYTLHFVAENRA